MTVEKIPVPALGDFDEVEVIEVHVAAGDVVSQEDPLITLESDKASVEVPAPKAGKVVEVLLHEGSLVREGAAILTLEVEGKGDGEAKPAAEENSSPPPAAATPAPPPVAPPAPPPAAAEGVLAGPAARRLARELEISLAAISGTGAKGRITTQDVKQAFLAANAVSGAGAAVDIPAPDYAAFGEIEVQRVSRFKRAGAKRLSFAWRTIPHVTHYDDADITELEALRKRTRAGHPGLTLLPFIMKACARIFADMPYFNASPGAKDGEIIIKRYIHIAMAVALENGLVAPVLRDVDKKSVPELAQEITDLAARAKSGQLKPDDMRGGSFSISNLGGIGGRGFSPIIQPYQMAVLGLSRARMEPVWDGKTFKPRLLMPFSLSYNHQMIDGAEAASFCRRLAAQLEDAALFALS